METIYKALIVKCNYKIYNGVWNTEIGFFKSQSNAWKHISEALQNNDCLLIGYIGLYTKIDGQIVEFNPKDEFDIKNIITDIENGQISSVRDFCGYNYSFYVTPIKIEDQKPNNIQIGDYLDAKEERYKYIEQIKDRLLKLEAEIYEIECHLQDYHSELQNKIKKRDEYRDEVCLRIQDYNTFLYDFKKDWNLNYEYENN